MSKNYQPPFYHPYVSDDESGTDTDTTTSGSDSDTDNDTNSAQLGPNFVKLASNLQLTKAAGQNFPTTKTEFEFGVNRLGKGASYSEFQPAPKDVSGMKLDTPQQDQTSVIMLDAIDRDRSVFPQPTDLVLRLPRIYRNVTSLQILQMKLLSSFFYFRIDKENLSLTIQEFQRLNYLLPAPYPLLRITESIREGSYNIASLLQELNTVFNTPPLFYDYPNGFTDFVPSFVSSGDFSLAFNYPGDYYFDSLQNKYIANPTRSFITLQYWPQTLLGFTPNLQQTKVAYYYPVLKELLLDDLAFPQNLSEQRAAGGRCGRNIFAQATTTFYPLDFSTVNTSLLSPGETIINRILFNFQGVNDPVVQAVIEANIATLDRYRLANTFRNGLANKYVFSVETNSNRIVITAPSLSSSLVNLLNFQYQTFFAQQLALYNLTLAQYNALVALNNNNLSILTDLYDYLQQNLAVYFGINFNTFALIYFLNINNTILIQDAINAEGISSNYDFNVITNPTEPITSDILNLLRADPPYLWPFMSNLPESTIAFNYNLGLPASNFTEGSNHPYDFILSNIDITSPVIDSNFQIQSDPATKSINILLPLEAAKYTVFRFKSDFRQTLQVETLPRPTQYRYPLYNQCNNAYDSTIKTYFDNSYCFLYNAQNQKMDNIAQSNLTLIYGFSNSNGFTSNFGIDFSNSRNYWGASNLRIDVVTPQYNFVVYTPKPPSPSPVGPAYTHQLQFAVQNTNPSPGFPADLQLFLYHDRAGFMADAYNVRNEDPLHYIDTLTIPANNLNRYNLNITAYAGDTYYGIIRSASTTFAVTNVQIVPNYPNGPAGYATLTSTLVGFNPLANPLSNLGNYNYATLADSNFLRLPINSNLWPPDPTGDEVNTGLVISTFAIGYDSNIISASSTIGVSTDLTDYMGYNASNPTRSFFKSSVLRVDPVNQFFFQTNSPYSFSNQSYLYPGASNFVLCNITQDLYNPLGVAQREYKIVHWYPTHYIPQPETVTLRIPDIDLSPNVSSYTTASTQGIPLSNYLYDPTNDKLQLGIGVVGFTFTPSDGVWEMDRFMFRSAATNPFTDLNSNIAFVGVFQTRNINNLTSNQVILSNAITKLNFYKRRTYNSNSLYQSNFGFDPNLGTYYEFLTDSNFNVGSNKGINGFSQNAGRLYTNTNAFYSVLAFDSNQNLTTFHAPTGSLTPYPYVSEAIPSTFYIDGTPSPNGNGLVVADYLGTSNDPYGPDLGDSPYTSQYELSIPINTEIMHYLSPINIVTDLSGFQPWTGVPYQPNTFVASPLNIIMVESTDYRFYSYTRNTSNRNFNYLFTMTADQIFPAWEATGIVAVSGNSSNFAFLGFSNTVGGVQPRIKILNACNYALTDINVPATFEIPDAAFAVRSFSFTDSNGFVISGTTGGGAARVYRTPNLATPYFIENFVAPFDSVISVQPPSGNRIFMMPTIGGNSSNIFFRVDENGPSALRRPFLMSNIGVGTIPNYFNSIGIARSPSEEAEIFFTSDQPTYNSNYYKVTNLFLVALPNPSFAELTRSLQSFTATGTLFQIVGGAEGSKWAFFQGGNHIWGNRNDSVDAPVSITNAFQIFIPNQKVVLRKVANEVNAITNLDGLQYPEYPHTSMFAYSNEQKLFNDCSAQKWGLESSGNFLVANVNLGGYYFNSYIYNVPLLPNNSIYNSNPYYYLAVRSYAPSEKSQVLLRFVLPQSYDFGFLRLRDLSDEIMMRSNIANISNFNPEYWDILPLFDSNFHLSNVNFGANPAQGLQGSNFTINGFGDYLYQLSTLYSSYLSNANTINQINSNLQSNMLNFIGCNLQFILPQSALTRTNYTAPLTFSILFRSALTPTFLALEDQWGLGWNLGFPKVDTPYFTVQTATSFYKILDDYIFLRLNQEFDMNRVDCSAKENLKETLEPTGQIRNYNAKLLLANFGNYAQTMIQNPVYFNPPLQKLDKLRFQWVNSLGQIIDNSECEWNTAVQIVERVKAPQILSNFPVIVPPQ